jgi:ABC-2 type transport system ATP-binding protein
MHNGVITTCDSPADLKKSYPYQIIELGTPERILKSHLADVPLIDINAFGNKYHLVVADAAAAMAQVRLALFRKGITITSLTQIPPTLEDVFVALASEVA